MEAKETIPMWTEDFDGTTTDFSVLPTPPRQGISPALAAAAAIGAAVALSLGAYGNVHAPTGQGIATFGFPAVLPMKAWFTTVALLLGLVQIVSALGIWERLPGLTAGSTVLATAHRWLGTLTFLFTLPVAYHCLWSLGFRQSDGRVLVHSILGCLFYGVFVTKMLLLRLDRLPGLTLPVAGGILFSVLVGLWLSSSLWFFNNFGFPGI